MIVAETQTAFTCKTCWQVKDEAEFRPSEIAKTDPECRTCRNAYEKAWREGRDPEHAARDRKKRSDRETIRSRRLRAEDPKAYGDRQRAWNYSLTPEQYDQMVLDQLGICANPRCARPLSHVDHDHACCPTGRNKQRTCGECVRGLLCRECNIALGIIGDSSEVLLGLVEYLSQRGQ
jgi:Recombination endonuclease VII